MVGYGASPNEVVDIVSNLPGPVVRGNHDKACAGIGETFGFNAVADKAVSWTAETLTPEIGVGAEAATRAGGDAGVSGGTAGAWIAD